jgi:acetolactate synthase-1/2/3 large subunit
MTIGEALVKYLEARGVDVIFGIPGVHTIELYRGLAQSSIRHITARHEQGVGFMADGYARVSGQAGIAFVITGPGMANMLTPMAQALADSIPMLVISGVNQQDSLGKGLGHLHELPNQQDLCAQVATTSTQINQQSELIPALDQAFEDFIVRRPAPFHIQIPTDVMNQSFDWDDDLFSKFSDQKLLTAAYRTNLASTPAPQQAAIDSAVKRLIEAKSIVMLAGGGAKNSAESLQSLAETFAAPVILTTNGRGLMHQHALCVPASPSLESVRQLIRKADCVLAVGTEMGFTDYDAYRDDNFPVIPHLIRIDICADQLERQAAELRLLGDANIVLTKLLNHTQTEAHTASPESVEQAHKHASIARDAAFAELSTDYREHIALLNTLRDYYPNTYFIGDSTQLIYAGGLYYDHDKPGGWFNAATGFGALGYAIPAAVGAAIAKPENRIICIVGDGGAQFTLPELMTAVQEKLDITFVVWNNQGYLEIETSMASVNIDAVGCDPQPPIFEHIAKACSIPFAECTKSTFSLQAALIALADIDGPTMIEIIA